MLPQSLWLTYALNNATFQVSSLALLSIVNTRVEIPAEYLPAYGAISFLPYSLRPFFAWISSLLLKIAKTPEENKNRHDKLLFLAFLMASLSFLGTVCIPSGGIILCFFWGFVRGIAGAWTDFLIGMAVIEVSRLEASHFLSPSQSEGGATYEQIVSINTAQSSTAKNVGSCLVSIATFAFFSKTRNLGDNVANTLLLGTAGIFLLSSFISLKFKFHVDNLSTNLDAHHYSNVENAVIEHIDDATCDDLIENIHHTSSELLLSGSQSIPSDDVDSSSSSLQPPLENTAESIKAHRQQIAAFSTLISFQILLALSALRKPIIAMTNQTILGLLVAIFLTFAIFTIWLGYRFERHAASNTRMTSSISHSGDRSQSQKIPHRQLNLYFLLRYSLPIAGFLMYSYLYSVFEKEPMFLQLLEVLKTATGFLSTYCYEKFLSPYCHSGWPLIRMIASLDFIMGFVALLDIWVIRSVKVKEIDGEYTVDNSLRFLVAAVGLVKYFFAELDYMPALVLSTTNVYSDNDVDHPSKTNTDDDHQSDGDTSPLRDLTTSNVLAFDTNLGNDGRLDTPRPPTEISTENKPIISSGMQYASFLSCIDFGAQIGDWITVPIVALLDITRENHWNNLDKLVIICSVFRMIRVVFLWLICPPNNSHYKTKSPGTENKNLSNGSNPIS